MPIFELDTTTAQALEEAAKSTNMTVGEFVRFRLLVKPNCDATNDAESMADFSRYATVTALTPQGVCWGHF